MSFSTRIANYTNSTAGENVTDALKKGVDYTISAVASSNPDKLVEFSHESANITDGTAVGNITITSNSTAYNSGTSDRTVKKNFEEWTEDTLSIFKNLNPQKFNFITENDSEKKTKGFIAQDLVEHFPEAYPKDETTDKYWFNPSGMVVYLMKAIQELEAKVAALEAA
jgi:hypothetical protein